MFHDSIYHGNMHTLYNRLEVTFPFRFIPTYKSEKKVLFTPTSSVEANLLLGVSPSSIFGHSLLKIAQVTDDTVTTFVRQEFSYLTNVVAVSLKCCIS